MFISLDSPCSMMFKSLTIFFIGNHESNRRIAMEIVEELLNENPIVIDMKNDSKKPIVLMRELDQSSICLRATVWINSADENFIACSDLRIQIKEAFDNNNIEIPYAYMKSID